MHFQQVLINILDPLQKGKLTKYDAPKPHVDPCSPRRSITPPYVCAGLSDVAKAIDSIRNDGVSFYYKLRRGWKSPPQIGIKQELSTWESLLCQGRNYRL